MLVDLAPGGERKGRTCPAAGGDRSHPRSSQRAMVEEREPGGRGSQVGGLGKQRHTSTEAGSTAHRAAPARCRDHGPVPLGLAALTVLRRWPRAQAGGQAQGWASAQGSRSPGSRPGRAGLGGPARCARRPGKPCCLRGWHRPSGHEPPRFLPGRRARATSLVSQMERAAPQSPEPGGCLPAAPLQPKWKNIQPRRGACLPRPRAPAEPPPGPADAETLTLAFFWPSRFRREAERLRHPWPCCSARR